MDAETTLPTCYRHTDRETRLACSSCERPVCLDCVRTAAVGQKCVECAAPAPGQRTVTVRPARGGLRQVAPATYGIIVVCVAVYLASLAFPPVFIEGAQVNSLVAEGQWWRVLTAAFLHSIGSFLHIGFNMYALYLFGPGLEQRAGSRAFLALYLSSALAGGAAYYLPFALEMGGQGEAVGASGAVFGLFGATLALAWRYRGTAPGRAGVRQLLTLLAINLALPLIVPRIAWQAHLGGLVAGIVIASAWTAMGWRGRDLGEGRRTAVGLAVGLASFLIVLWA